MGVCISSSHLHIFSSSHLLIFTPFHLHICSSISSSHIIFTPSHLHTFTDIESVSKTKSNQAADLLLSQNRIKDADRTSQIAGNNPALENAHDAPPLLVRLSPGPTFPIVTLHPTMSSDKEIWPSTWKVSKVMRTNLIMRTVKCCLPNLPIYPHR